MIHERYVIVETTAGWMIRYTNDDNGPYKSMAEAVLCAIDAANELGRAGIDIEVCVMSAEGTLRTEWAYRRSTRSPAATASLALPPHECAAVLADAAALRR